MSDSKRENLTGHPSDYGGRTLAGEEANAKRSEQEERTADGDPLTDRGTADSAMNHDQRSDQLRDERD
jgi:hypothetical protein